MSINAEINSTNNTINSIISPPSKIIPKQVVLHEIDSSSIGLGNVENKSSATIRSEIVDSDIPSTIARDSELATHTGSTSNPHSVTATQVGLGNATNESKATMFTSPTFTGNVGIGTSSPNEILHGEDSSSSNGTSLTIQNAFGESPKNIKFRYTDNVETARIEGFGRNNTSSLPYLAFHVNQTTDSTLSNTVAERMRITSTGNVGIGKTDPDKLLVVRGANAEIVIDDTSSTPVLRFRENGSTKSTISTINQSLAFTAGGSTERMRINSTGEVGIGKTAATGVELDVNGDIAASGVSTANLSVTNMLNSVGDIEADGAEFGMSGGSVEFGGQVTFNDVAEFQDEADFSGGSITGLLELSLGSGGLTVDTNVLSVNGTSNKVGIRHTPTSSSAVLHVNGDVTVEDGGEKSLEIITGAYSYKLGDIDSGESGSHLEIAAPDANFIFNNGKVGINKTPSSGIDLDVNGATTIGGTLTCAGAIIATSDIQFESTIDLVGGSGISATDTIETTGIVKAKGYALDTNTFTVVSITSTLASSTNGLTVILQNTGPITITLPTLTAGHVTTFITETIHAVSFVNDTGVTVNSFNGANTTAGQFAQCQVIYKTSTVAFLGGNIV